MTTNGPRKLCVACGKNRGVHLFSQPNICVRCEMKQERLRFEARRRNRKYETKHPTALKPFIWGQQ